MCKVVDVLRCKVLAAAADLNGLSLALPVLNPFCQGIKAFWGVDPAGNALRKEPALAVFGSHGKDVQVLQAPKSLSARPTESREKNNMMRKGRSK